MIDPPGRLRSWAVPLVPFLWSLGLSVATVGSTVFWQDSGFYLTAVHEFSVLYPHGFVLYLALCKAWTVVAAPVLGFTLAVHAFSILCAAAASSCIALAARALLRRVEPLASPNLAAIGAACLAATGYSFWHAAILAKTYALYYLALAALLWLMARAERKSEFLAMGAVLGLAWAAHPSATLLLPVMLAYAWARRDRIREWGWGFAAGVVGLAAVVAIAPALFLPLIAQRGTPYDFDSPRTVGAMVEFLRGKRFTDGQGAFGFDGSRSLQAAQFVWEEYLGVGLVLLGIGAARLARRRPGLLGLLVAWVLPVAGTALVFRAEGQLDQWLVAAYVPLALLLAAGLQALGARNLSMPGAALAGALLWMLASNGPDLTQRRYGRAEEFGRFLLKNLDSNSMLVVTYDDSVATVSYLQAVRGERRDVAMIVGARLGLPWYDDAVRRFTPCRIPDWERSFRSMPGVKVEAFELNAFANENVAPGHPLFCEVEPDLQTLRPDLAVVPAGMLWKIAVRGESALDGRYWDYPADLIQLGRERRRPRGVVLRGSEGGLTVRPEPYENRLLLRLIHARLRLADLMLDRTPQASLDQYELVRRAYPPFEEDLKFLLQWGTALALTHHPAEAETVLRVVAERETSRRSRALAWYQLGEIAFEAGRKGEAQVRWRGALESGGLDDARRRRAEEGVRQP
ncbi:MAG TPA: DUF2723 domain-containing protein [Planctomycetota bacterium]|nr:DUF2723 domain-containing protein [Planctomycetota bacterium]